MNRQISCITVCTIAAVLICTGSVTRADSNVSKCVNEAVKFDGTQPLTYADIIGPAGRPVVLSSAYPGLCKGLGARKCTALAHLKPGDTIAIASRCGDFAHVQFIGAHKVFDGWVPNESFSELAPRVPLIVPPSGGYTYVFRLTKGDGLPVCQAYLQRLNKSGFGYSHRPYCDRPENDAVPGFSKLERIPLQPPEVNKLYKLVFNFENPPRQFEIDQLKSIRRGESNVTPDVGVGLDAWRYNSPLDIFNDGAPVNLLMWRAVGQGAPITRCGLDLREAGRGQRSDQMPIVFKPGDGEIDAQATKLLIAHPIQKYDSSLQTGNLYSTATDFRPIARSIGIFKYRNLYYFDGFFDIWGDAKNERRGRPALANTLAVFLHKDGVSRQMCEYDLIDRQDYPTP
jgi:hypothetical protein